MGKGLDGISDSEEIRALIYREFAQKPLCYLDFPHLTLHELLRSPVLEAKSLTPNLYSTILKLFDA